jgi:hypothetical protein
LNLSDEVMKGVTSEVNIEAGMIMRFKKRRTKQA